MKLFLHTSIRVSLERSFDVLYSSNQTYRAHRIQVANAQQVLLSLRRPEKSPTRFSRPFHGTSESGRGIDQHSSPPTPRLLLVMLLCCHGRDASFHTRILSPFWPHILVLDAFSHLRGVEDLGPKEPQSRTRVNPITCPPSAHGLVLHSRGPQKNLLSVARVL